MEMPVHRKYLSALLKCFDREGNGTVVFEEFLNHVLFDPYK